MLWGSLCGWQDVFDVRMGGWWWWWSWNYYPYLHLWNSLIVWQQPVLQASLSISERVNPSNPTTIHSTRQSDTAIVKPEGGSQGDGIFLASWLACDHCGYLEPLGPWSLHWWFKFDDGLEVVGSNFLTKTHQCWWRTWWVRRFQCTNVFWEDEIQIIGEIVGYGWTWGDSTMPCLLHSQVGVLGIYYSIGLQPIFQMGSQMVGIFTKVCVCVQCAFVPTGCRMCRELSAM